MSLHQDIEKLRKEAADCHERIETAADALGVVAESINNRAKEMEHDDFLGSQLRAWVMMIRNLCTSELYPCARQAEEIAENL